VVKCCAGDGAGERSELLHFDGGVQADNGVHDAVAARAHLVDGEVRLCNVSM
jgi:hypothetical protein